MHKQKQIDDTGSRGATIIELALIIPLFFSVALVGLEISRALSYTQASVSLSREAAARTFRKCAHLWTKDANDGAAAVCLENFERQLENFAGRIFPDTEVILSLYRYGSPDAPPDCGGVVLADGFTRVARAGTGRYPSKVNFRNAAGVPDPGLTTGNNLDLIDSRTACMVRMVVIAEVYVPYSVKSGDAGPLFSFNPTEFYSVATL